MMMAMSKFGMSEKEFWRCSPRKLIALIGAWNDLEISLRGGKKKVKKTKDFTGRIAFSMF